VSKHSHEVEEWKNQDLKYPLNPESFEMVGELIEDKKY